MKKRSKKKVQLPVGVSGLRTAREAARYLRVSQFTLRKIDESVLPYRTPGGHRRYSLRMLNRYLNNSRR